MLSVFVAVARKNKFHWEKLSLDKGKHKQQALIRAHGNKAPRAMRETSRDMDNFAMLAVVVEHKRFRRQIMQENNRRRERKSAANSHQ
jgi:hypothetical protein